MAKNKRNLERKDVTFGIRMSREEVCALDKKAALSGVSRNELIRRCTVQNVTIVDAHELIWAMDQMRLMRREYDKHLDRFYGLAQEALESGLDDQSEILGKVLEECVCLEGLRASMLSMEKTISKILRAMLRLTRIGNPNKR